MCNQEDSLKDGAGVFGPHGIIGKINAVSGNFASGWSVLHTNLMISAMLKKSNTLCTVSWSGEEPSKLQLLYVPKYINLMIGDTVVTSGYNSSFVKNIDIGKIEEIVSEKDAAFQKAIIKPFTDFNSVGTAYIIVDTKQIEKDSLEQLHYEP